MRTKCHPVSRVPSNRTYFCQLFILYIKLKGVIPFLFLAIKLILKALNWLMVIQFISIKLYFFVRDMNQRINLQHVHLLDT